MTTADGGTTMTVSRRRRSAPGPALPDGTGLLGLRERVAAAGGSVATAPRDGFQLVGDRCRRAPAPARGDRVIRVLLAEDQGMMRSALALLLGLEPDIEVVAEVAAGTEVVAAALETTPGRRAARHRDARHVRAGRDGAAPRRACRPARC